MDKCLGATPWESWQPDGTALTPTEGFHIISNIIHVIIFVIKIIIYVYICFIVLEDTECWLGAVV